MDSDSEIRSTFSAALYVAAALKIVAVLVIIGGVVATIAEAKAVASTHRLAYISAAIIGTVFAASIVAAAAYGLEVPIEIHAELWEANHDAEVG